MRVLLFLALLASFNDDEWQERLGRERYRIMRDKGTEPSYSGTYAVPGTSLVYLCAACDSPLFRSQEQYDVGNGWPNFTYPIAKESVYYLEDWSIGFKRYEVLCRCCNGHLGHVFNDGPPPKNLRFCINSICLKIENQE
ncbi:MAG: peptide-methionine (R)-S-oxide reductase MsrB [Chlamydiia bacterium]|nr:peptide-methionine (R)-S-oxide reductase MsrB [Chlamydiia bacterium]